MSGPRRWWLLATVSLGLVMIVVDNTILYTALPVLTGDLGADPSSMLWIINSYPLVMAGLLLGAGTLGDKIGYRRMFLTGLIVFGLASLAAAFAPTPAVLIAARALLGVGAAILMPATLSLVRVAFEDERERSIAIGIWATTSVLGMALGPILGGVLLEHFWWGSVFLINVPIVLLALAAGLVLAPRTTVQRDKPWDLVASLMAMAGLVGLVYALKESVRPDGNLLHVAVAAVVALIAGILFVRRQKGQEHPLLDLALLRNPRLQAGFVAAALALFATTGAQLVLSQRLQLVDGRTPLQTGLVVAAIAVGCLPTGLVGGALTHRHGARRVILSGLTTSAAGTLLVLTTTPGVLPLLPETAPPAWVVPGLLLLGAGMGLTMTAASATIMDSAPAHRAGMAASVNEVAYKIGTLFGMAIFGSVLGSVYTATVDLPAGTSSRAEAGMDQARALAETLPAAPARALLDAAATAFDRGFHWTLVIGAALLACGALFTALRLGRSTSASRTPGRVASAAPGAGTDGS
ncbi:Methyl viologen resistance protein SmvA [Streptomyces sp. ADI96-02]|uniref:MFS transporter n=1 Tax=unclassified Streptomyces TaxID=2593676 RepID=UPI000F55612A|nr:MFS transporter [Streptomyces sp. ADI96-02]RPK60539.1 Methyl viologen resistance protein SmvA [Streptomyces sp. ADI96-02]